MTKLIVKTNGVMPRDIELQPGVNKIGRAFSNDFQIQAPSISSHHCEILWEDGAIIVKDLGSTNGTFIDQQKITESSFTAGQTLRLGDILLEYEMTEAPKTGLRVNRVIREEPVAFPVGESGGLPIPPRVTADPIRKSPPAKLKFPENFYRNIPGALLFPFQRSGWIYLLCGTFLMALATVNVPFFRVGLLIGVRILFGCCMAGYIFHFLKDNIVSGARGEEEPPSWPEWENWWDSGFGPMLELLGLMAISFGPSILCEYLGGEDWEILSDALVVVGCIYFPMAFLAVSMAESITALNPVTVVVSISRVPKEYLVLCLVLGALTGVYYGFDYMMRMYVPSIYVPSVVMDFFSLYLWMSSTRLIGLLYYGKREELGWVI